MALLIKQSKEHCIWMTWLESHIYIPQTLFHFIAIGMEDVVITSIPPTGTSQRRASMDVDMRGFNVVFIPNNNRALFRFIVIGMEDVAITSIPLTEASLVQADMDGGMKGLRAMFILRQ